MLWKEKAPRGGGVKQQASSPAHILSSPAQLKAVTHVRMQTCWADAGASLWTGDFHGEITLRSFRQCQHVRPKFI